MTASPPRRRPSRKDTQLGDAVRACARHLKDLERFHAGPPPDVRVDMSRSPRFLTPEPESSYFSSPAALCADLVK
jgi:hypothetical protein